MLEYILLIMEQIVWVSWWFVLNKYIVKMFLFSNRSWNLLLYYVFTSMLTWCIDEWYRLLIQFVRFLKEYDKKISNLVILDNSGTYFGGRVDYLSFFDYLSSFCLLSIEFYCTFCISFKILTDFVHYYCILVRMW